MKHKGLTAVGCGGVAVLLMLFHIAAKRAPRVVLCGLQKT